jgi:hypothetical protein
MTGKLIVELPESLKRNIETLAQTEGYTVDQFIASAAAEKIAAMRTVEYLRQEAAKGRREDFARVLASVPSAPVADTDRLPDDLEPRPQPSVLNLHTHGSSQPKRLLHPRARGWAFRYAARKPAVLMWV